MKIISRAEAKARGLKHYFTGKPCCHGHIERRYVSSHGCVECVRLATIDWCKRNRDKRVAYNRRYRRENPENSKEILRYGRTKEYQREYNRKRYMALKVLQQLNIKL